MMCNVHREEFDSLRPSLSLPTRHSVLRTLQQTGIIITIFFLVVTIPYLPKRITGVLSCAVGAGARSAPSGARFSLRPILFTE